MSKTMSTTPQSSQKKNQQYGSSTPIKVDENKETQSSPSTKGGQSPSESMKPSGTT